MRSPTSARSSFLKWRSASNWRITPLSVSNLCANFAQSAGVALGTGVSTAPSGHLADALVSADRTGTINMVAAPGRFASLRRRGRNRTGPGGEAENSSTE